METIIHRLDPPKEIPFGWTGEYFVTGSKRRFSLPQNKYVWSTPFMAHSEQDMIDRGMSALMTIGSQNTHTANQNRCVFIDGGFLEGYGIPLIQMNKAQCIERVWSLWNSLGRPGWITSGAQEGRHHAGGDQWAQIYSQCPQQYLWITEGFGQIEAQYPWFKYLGGYDGCAPRIDDKALVRWALSSDQNALQYMKTYERGEHPYFREELWRWQHVTLNHYYRSAIDTEPRYAELMITIEIVKRALRAVGREDRLIIVYGFPVYSEFVAYPGEGYSAHFHVDCPSGGYWEAYTFASYSPGIQFELVHAGLSRASGFGGWGDSRYFGRSKDVVGTDIIRESDNFPLQKYYGAGAVRGSNGPRPYVAGSPYGYACRPLGMDDMIYCAAEIYCTQVAWVGGSTQNVYMKHKPNGTSNYCSLEPTYVLDREEADEAIVCGWQNGNKVWIKVVDMAMGLTGSRLIDVLCPGGQSVTLKIWSGISNNFLIEFTGV